METKKKEWKKPELIKLEINQETKNDIVGTSFDGVIGIVLPIVKTNFAKK